MNCRKQKEKGRWVCTITVAVLFLTMVGGFGAWGIASSENWKNNILFLVGLSIFSLLYSVAVMLIVQRIARDKWETSETEDWFDRTMNLNDLPQRHLFYIEHEITAIHSDFIVT